MLTIEKIQEIVKEKLSNGETVTELEFPKDELLELKLMHNNDMIQNHLDMRPRPPVSGRGSSYGGLFGGTTGSWKTLDYQASEYMEALEKWKKRGQQLYDIEFLKKDIYCATIAGMVKLVAKDESDTST